MRGEDIGSLVAPLDGLFLEAESRGIVTIGIGDGGNEVGMGRVFQGVSRAIRHGRRIASTVLTDYVIVSGVSNWGAWIDKGRIMLGIDGEAVHDAGPARDRHPENLLSAILAAALVGVPPEAIVKARASV